MKEYVNNASTIRILILPINIIFIGLTIFRCITFAGEDMSGLIAMSIVFTLICVLFDFMFIYLKNLMYSTKFNNEKIEQKYVFHKKTILYKEVKTVLLVGTVIVLSNDIVDVNKLPKKGNILKKCFNNNVMFYLGNNNSILDVISSNINCNAFIINSTHGSKERFQNYFNVIN